MDIKKNLGKKIRELRLSHFLTQEMLAEKIQLSAKSLSQIELGNNFVSAETLKDLCIAIDVDVKTLFDFEFKQVKNLDKLETIIFKLKRNPKLLTTIYKIVLALE